MEWRDEVADAEEFVESLKSDVFQDMIYVFTPKGDIIELPAGATPVDFAYRIHTEVGHHCVGAKVNDQLVPLDYKLQNGQVVQIMTSKSKVGPSRDWLQARHGYVTTASAREKIRQWFRRQERDENIAQGREILERELRRLGSSRSSKTSPSTSRATPRSTISWPRSATARISPQPIATKLSDTSVRGNDRYRRMHAPSPTGRTSQGPGRRRSADQPGRLLQAGLWRRDHRLCHARDAASPSTAPTARTSPTSPNRND